jgi:hypothetical protein
LTQNLLHSPDAVMILYILVVQAISKDVCMNITFPKKAQNILGLEDLYSTPKVKTIIFKI